MLGVKCCHQASWQSKPDLLTISSAVLGTTATDSQGTVSIPGNNKAWEVRVAPLLPKGERKPAGDGSTIPGYVIPCDWYKLVRQHRLWSNLEGSIIYLA